MSTSAKRKTPKIGDIYVTRGYMVFKLLLKQPSYLTPGSNIQFLAEEVTLPPDSALLLMDQSTLKELIPEMRSDGIVYKFLSLMEKRIVYYVALHLTRPLTAQDYKLAFHEFFHMLSPLSDS